MKIIHFEDEWAKTRSIPHRLHDRIFEFLAPEKRVTLELNEYEDSKTPDKPSRILVSLAAGSDSELIFEYILVTELETLAELASSEDVVIVDIMRSDDRGRFVSMLQQIIELLTQRRFNKDNWRYFSAFPEKIGDSRVLEGYTKKQASELIEFLFSKVLERKPCL
jgi:hypothetical protein